MRANVTTRTLGVLSLALAAAVSATPAHAAPARTVVVTGRGDAAAAVQRAGGTVLRRLPLVHGVVARVSGPVPGFTVTADGPMTLTGRAKGSSDTGTTELTARDVLGVPAGAGAGVTVAVVDTGVADLPELAGRVTHVDVSGDGAGDGYGHGTFVAALVAGAEHGVATEADVLDVRVAQDDGSTTLVDVLTGLQAVSEHPEVAVVNLSLSTDEEVPPLTDALDALWAMGDLVVVPAGNDGPGRGTVASPGTDPLLLTVGALDGDTVAEWSGRGGQGVKDPDLVAPGAHLISAGLPGSVLWNEHPDARRGAAGFIGSGTSFSTALVSGGSAALLAARAQLAPHQVKALLERSAAKVAGARWATGAGALDLNQALVQRVPAGQGPGGDLDGSDASSWNASSWSASSWSARQWAASSWSARQWSASSWSARQWSARQWSARQWSARQWSASEWSARQWSARQWSARQWSARQWSASSWE